MAAITIYLLNTAGYHAELVWQVQDGGSGTCRCVESVRLDGCQGRTIDTILARPHRCYGTLNHGDRPAQLRRRPAGPRRKAPAAVRPRQEISSVPIIRSTAHSRPATGISLSACAPALRPTAGASGCNMWASANVDGTSATQAECSDVGRHRRHDGDRDDDLQFDGDVGGAAGCSQQRVCVPAAGVAIDRLSAHRTPAPRNSIRRRSSPPTTSTRRRPPRWPRP